MKLQWKKHSLAVTVARCLDMRKCGLLVALALAAGDLLLLTGIRSTVYYLPPPS